MNLFSYLTDPANTETILRLLGQHVAYTAAAVAIAALVALPLGVLIGHTRRGSLLVIGLANGMRAIPTLGLLFLAIMLLGTGAGNIIAVLAILALPPILTATATGVAGADREAVHAARALGMTEGQIVARVEWPLALPLVVSGLRSATLQVVATATVAAFGSGGGLGQLLTSGQAQRDYPQMFAGALLVAGLAVLLDLLLGGVTWLVARRARPARPRSAAPTLART